MMEAAVNRTIGVVCGARGSPPNAACGRGIDLWIPDEQAVGLRRRWKNWTRGRDMGQDGDSDEEEGPQGSMHGQRLRACVCARCCCSVQGSGGEVSY